LDYRDMHAYFGRQTKKLDAAEFAAADDEHRALAAKGEARDDEEEARFAELSTLLLRD
jgi:hypothetical protein